MTAIVGYGDGTTVWIGADSAATDYSDLQSTRADKKVFENGGFLFGCCGSPRFAQMLRYSLDPPHPPPDGVAQDMKYMCTDFINAVRDQAREAGVGKEKNGVESTDGSLFLVGWRGTIYLVCEDYQVETTEFPYNATGSGGHVALGALYGVSLAKPRQAITRALRAAEEHIASVRGPFEILELRS